jgi:hypothetical protein
VEIAVLRIANAANQWGLPFDGIELAKKVDTDLGLKRRSYCQALAADDRVQVRLDTLHAILQNANGNGGENDGTIFFSGKDALVVVGVALKAKIGSCETAITKADHLTRVLRLSAPVELGTMAPFSAIGRRIDAA